MGQGNGMVDPRIRAALTSGRAALASGAGPGMPRTPYPGSGGGPVRGRPASMGRVPGGPQPGVPRMAGPRQAPGPFPGGAGPAGRRGPLPRSANAGFLYPRLRGGRRGFIEGGPVGSLGGAFNHGGAAPQALPPGGSLSGLFRFAPVADAPPAPVAPAPPAADVPGGSVVEETVEFSGPENWSLGEMREMMDQMARHSFEGSGFVPTGGWSRYYADPGATSHRSWGPPVRNLRGPAFLGSLFGERGGRDIARGSGFVPLGWGASQDGIGGVGGSQGSPPVWRRGYQSGGEVEMMEGIGSLVAPRGPGPVEQAALPGALPGAEVVEESVSRDVVTDFGVPGDEELVRVYTEAVAALEGGHPNPEQAIAKYVELFGEEALVELQAMVSGGEGLVPDSDGMSDSIPANIDGVEDVALSEGEYVVPADAVSGIGNGDTNSGARRLTELVESVRQARTGSPEIANQIDFEELRGSI